MARVLGVVVVLVFGIGLGAAVVASLTGVPPSPHARPGGPTIAELFSLIFTGIALVGLVVAWKWELTGALIVLVAYACAISALPSMFGGPALVIPIPAILFLVSWWLRRRVTPAHTGAKV